MLARRARSGYALGMNGLKFGIEMEYALIRPDGRFADYTNTSYSEVRALLEGLPDYGHKELRSGDAGIRVKNWYVEGDERFDECGLSTGMAVKGLEIRTPVFATIEESIASLSDLRDRLSEELRPTRWSTRVIGFNPCTSTYRPSYTPWEKEFHRSHIENALPEISTLSFGPDLNFSCSDDTPENVIEKVKRLTYYSPFIVPFSFSSPIVGGALWEGLSYRTFMRTGPRPSALAHLATGSDDILVKAADPPSQHLRIEFKAFDMVSDDRLLLELFYLILGISLSDVRQLPGTADRPDQRLHRRVAVAGFDDDEIHGQARKVVAAAATALHARGMETSLRRLEEMLASRRTPAHSMRELFENNRALYAKTAD